MAVTGVPSVTIGATTIPCLQNVRLMVDGEDITYYCSGNLKHDIGAQNISLSFSTILNITDTATVAVLQVGNTGTTHQFNPSGDTAGNVEYTTTDGRIQHFEHGAEGNGRQVVDVVCIWNDITDTVAS